MGEVIYTVASGDLKSHQFEGGLTLGALKSATSTSSFGALVNGEPQDDSFQLRDGDRVDLSKPVKAGQL
jgi:hypothetical protein